MNRKTQKIALVLLTSSVLLFGIGGCHKQDKDKDDNSSSPGIRSHIYTGGRSGSYGSGGVSSEAGSSARGGFGSHGGGSSSGG